MAINPFTFTQPQAYSGGIDWSPLERIGAEINKQREEAEAAKLIAALYGTGNQQAALAPSRIASGPSLGEGATSSVVGQPSPPSIPLPRARPPEAPATPIVPSADYFRPTPDAAFPPVASAPPAAPPAAAAPSAAAPGFLQRLREGLDSVTPNVFGGSKTPFPGATMEGGLGRLLSLYGPAFAGAAQGDVLNNYRGAFNAPQAAAAPYPSAGDPMTAGGPPPASPFPSPVPAAAAPAAAAPAPEPVAESAPPPPSSDGLDRALRVIRQKESSGNYGNVTTTRNPRTGKMQSALGAYGIMDFNVGPWSKEVLGRELTQDEFLRNNAAQDAIARAKFGQYAQKYGLSGAARAWIGGPGNMNRGDVADALGTTPLAYGADFERKMGLPLEITTGASRPAQAAPQAMSFDQVRDQAVNSLTSQQAQSGLSGEQIGALYANSVTRPLALSLLQKQLDPGSYTYQVVGDRLLALNSRGGPPKVIAENVDAGKDYEIKTDENGRLVRVKKVGPEGPINPQAASAAAGQDITGDEYLQTLDPARQKQVKALVEGRAPPPTSLALKSPAMQSLLRDAAQYDPGFDLTLWKARNAMYTNVTSGKMGQNLASFNTTIGHMDSLDKTIDGLENSNYPLYNQAANAIRRQYDPAFDAALKKFETAKTAVVDELTRAFRGTGGNVHDLVQWEKQLNAADSPEALRGVIKQGIDLLHSRIEAVGEQYNRGMAKKVATDATDLLSPKAKQVLERLESGTPQQKQQATPPPQQAGPVRISSDAEYEKLLPKTQFIGPDGKLRTKP